MSNSPNLAATGIPRRMQSGPAPLSLAQQRLWFLDQLQPNSSAYNITQVFRLRGSLNVDALEQALNEIRRRHEVLRANFDSVDDQPVQIVAPFQPMPLTVVDYSNLIEDQRESAWQDAFQTYSRRPFNLKNDPLMRANLLRLGTTEHVLVLIMHHIISDGWSVQLIAQESASLYEAFSQEKPSPLPELPIQYSDYACWQREWFQGAVLEKQLSYWKYHLGGSLPVLELPADRRRPSVQTFNGRAVAKVLPPELVQSLKSLSQRRRATLFVTLLAAVQILLQRLSDQEDIVLGTPIAGRKQWETEKLVGFFVNTLAVRADLSGNPTFEALLERVRSVVLDAMDHQEMPFEKLVQELQPERSLSHTPLFQVMVNVFMLDHQEIGIPGLAIENLTPLGAEAKCDVTVYILKEGQNLRVTLIYNTDLFEAMRMEEMLDQFFLLLQQIAAAPDKPIGSYSLVTEKSRQFLPDPTAELSEPPFAAVTTTFLSRAGESPKQHAVTQTGHSWTYEELSASAAGIARSLLTRGLQRGEVVAVTGPRSFGLIASVVGVFMSSGTLLTVDPNLPINRQRLMLTEARAKYLLKVGEWRGEDEWLRAIPGLEIIAVTKQEGIAPPTGTISLPDVSADDAAYIFFTSGTTGVPKGVLGCQKGLGHFLAWQKSTFDVGPTDRCAQLTNLSFEVVLRDIFLPLVSGATLCLLDEAADPASDQTLSWMDREGITLFHAVPSLSQTWLAGLADGVTLRKLRWALLAGEPLTEAFVQRWRDALPQTGKIVNLYGPAETTLAKCSHIVPGKPSYGIQHLGRPLPQTQALVLNRNGHLCGVGEPGEIVIRTPFRTLGYINAPDEQQRRFVRNPFRGDPTDIVYCSGDRGRYRADGTLEFLGRVDDQVKIRGVRIEPAEITAILGRHPKVKACFVTACKDPQGNDVLVAYVVATAANAVMTNDLRSYMGEHLPGVMAPSAFVFLDALPLTPNGKVDRRALTPLNLAKTEVRSAFVMPRTPAEHLLAHIWCRVLKLTQVGVQDTFFDLGGHSLLATQLVSQIRRELNVELPLRTIFAKPTIESLALHLLEQKAIASSSDEIEELLAEVESLSDESAESQVRSLEREDALAQGDDCI
jgi:amino acid adenylation domain-containing protein